jgi:myo-inositol-1-phosphate synthase
LSETRAWHKRYWKIFDALQKLNNCCDSGGSPLKEKNLKLKDQIEAPKGKLGVLIPGLGGAVSTTFIAGVELVRRGLAEPIGSLTQIGTIRLGKRYEHRSPKITDFIPLASLDNLVFGGWDIYEANGYEAAMYARVLNREHLEPIKDFLGGIRPMKAAFDGRFVRNLDGTHVKKNQSLRQQVDALKEDIVRFQSDHALDRCVKIGRASCRERV